MFAARTGVENSEHISEHGGRFRQDDTVNAEAEVIPDRRMVSASVVEWGP